MKFHIKKRGSTYYFNIIGEDGKALASSEPHKSKPEAHAAITAIWDGCDGTQSIQIREAAIVDETGE